MRDGWLQRLFTNSAPFDVFFIPLKLNFGVAIR